MLVLLCSNFKFRFNLVCSFEDTFNRKLCKFGLKAYRFSGLQNLSFGVLAPKSYFLSARPPNGSSLMGKYVFLAIVHRNWSSDTGTHMRHMPTCWHFPTYAHRHPHVHTHSLTCANMHTCDHMGPHAQFFADMHPLVHIPTWAHTPTCVLSSLLDMFLNLSLMTIGQ